MKQNNLFLITAIIIFHSNAIYSQKKIKPPKNLVDSVSYAIGLNIAQGFESEFIEFNIDQFMYGVKARIAPDKDPIFSDKEAQEMVRMFFQTKRAGTIVSDAQTTAAAEFPTEEMTDSPNGASEINITSDTTVRIASLEVMDWDLGNKMEWEPAQKACAALGIGWRLPTINELNLLYNYKDEIGGFNLNNYWSSSLLEHENDAWSQSFLEGVQSEANIINEFYVRPVRSIND
ncbi:MAG: DUF1566 domain-containing protein [Flavobacteriales bacterium]|jgi:hypothetical protein|nr:DUF1566 domain-containing protein [Flavobacteriales bacterium]